MIRSTLRSSFALLIALLCATTAAAADKNIRGTARTSVNHNTNVNRNTNVNVNRNVNINRDVDVNVNVNNHYSGYGYGCCYHPVAAAAAVVATAAIIGSMVNTLPPACSAVVVNGMTYQNCGGTWYQPQFAGTSVTYLVVNAPR